MGLQWLPHEAVTKLPEGLDWPETMLYTAMGEGAAHRCTPFAILKQVWG